MDIKFSTVTVQRGSTWSIIAFEHYGDAFLMDDIIAANPEYSNVITFDGGERIKIPVRQSEPVIKVQTPWSQGTVVRIATWS